MPTTIEVLVPIPRRFAGRWRAAALPPRTRDLRLAFLLVGLGLVFWATVVWLLVAMTS